MATVQRIGSGRPTVDFFESRAGASPRFTGQFESVATQYQNLGRAIRLARRSAGLTQNELAARTKITINYLSLIENGHRDVSMRQLRSIAKSLNLPLWVIIFLSESPADISDEHTSEQLADLQSLVRDGIALTHNSNL
jgi:transcriptional regulator with XRE-family HTH domain